MDYSYCRVTSELGWYLEDDVHLGLRAAAGVAGAAAAAVAGIYLIFLSTSGTTSSSPSRSLGRGGTLLLEHGR